MTDNGLKNPIDEQSQIVQSLKEILGCPSSNFIAFLESEGACSISNFLNDCKHYEGYFDHITSQEASEDTKISEIESKEVSQMTLPDLVSNIPIDAMASPMPSPEKKSESDQTLTQKNCEDFDRCIWNYDSDKSVEHRTISTQHQILNKALDIFNSYIRPNCDYSIPLSTETQKDIADKVKENQFDLHLFNTAQEEIYSILNKQ